MLRCLAEKAEYIVVAECQHVRFCSFQASADSPSNQSCCAKHTCSLVGYLGASQSIGTLEAHEGDPTILYALACIHAHNAELALQMHPAGGQVLPEDGRGKLPQ